MRYKTLIAYDGAPFSGWQLQPNSRSIQGEIERALEILLKRKTRLVGSGRTDAGAHALGQVGHFDADDCPKLEAVNALLPREIRILEIEEAAPTFHAQYSATGKIYHYHLWLEKVADPFLWQRSFKIPFPISLDLLKEASHHFIGTHDFTTFANHGSTVKGHVRTLHRLDIIPQRGGVRLEFEGSGFLYKMVRNIVGTLVEIASGQTRDIPALFAAKDRRKAGICAPAHALFLMQVFYEKSRCGEKKRFDQDALSPFLVEMK